jgi:hypothetical protein
VRFGVEGRPLITYGCLLRAPPYRSLAMALLSLASDFLDHIQPGRLGFHGSTAIGSGEAEDMICRYRQGSVLPPKPTPRSTRRVRLR